MAYNESVNRLLKEQVAIKRHQNTCEGCNRHKPHHIHVIRDGKREIRLCMTCIQKAVLACGLF